MNYSWKKNDNNTGTQLNIANFKSLYGLIYFDLSYRPEQITRDPKQLVLKYRVNQASKAVFMSMQLFSMKKILLLIKSEIN